jgi:hypothetical protein
MDALQGQRVGRHVPDLRALAQDAQVGHALAALEVAHPQAAEFLTAQAMVKKRRQDGLIIRCNAASLRLRGRAVEDPSVDQFDFLVAMA